MFDSNLLYSDDQVVTADAASTNDLQHGPLENVTVQITVKAVSGTSPTVNITVRESADDSTYVDNTEFPQITAVGVYFRKITTRHEYTRLYYDVGGTTPSFTVTAGIVPAGMNTLIG